jgi:hypothetical protein
MPAVYNTCCSVRTLFVIAFDLHARATQPHLIVSVVYHQTTNMHSERTIHQYNAMHDTSSSSVAQRL